MSEKLDERIKSIEAVTFGKQLTEVISSLEIIMTMFEVDDNQKILNACKIKLLEGINKLKEFGAEQEAQKFVID